MRPAPRVLLLTATRDESDMYGWWLESAGYTVLVVSDVAAASRVAMSERVDVLVIDGLFARAATNVPLPEGLRIITLSGFVPETAGWPQQLPGEIRILKPCLPPQLAKRIEQLMSGSRERQRRRYG